MAEYNASGTLLRRYVHGVGSDDPLVWFEGTGTTSPKYLLADERGSIVSENNASGSVVQTHQYGPYGEPINQSTSRFRYTGQILIPGTELYHYKARVYHPKLGRFLQTDPIGYKDGMNWYAYVGNDPMNKLDPDGLCGTRIKGRSAVNCFGGDAKLSVSFGERQGWKQTGKTRLQNIGTVGESRDDINNTLDLATIGLGKLLKEGLKKTAVESLKFPVFYDEFTVKATYKESELYDIKYRLDVPFENPYLSKETILKMTPTGIMKWEEDKEVPRYFSGPKLRWCAQPQCPQGVE